MIEFDIIQKSWTSGFFCVKIVNRYIIKNNNLNKRKTKKDKRNLRNCKEIAKKPQRNSKDDVKKPNCLEKNRLTRIVFEKVKFSVNVCIRRGLKDPSFF